jgi:hypothetical protein
MSVAELAGSSSAPNECGHELRITSDDERIAEAISSDDPLSHWNIAYNPNLIPTQYLELHRKIASRIGRDTLLDHLSNPLSILYWNDGEFSAMARSFRNIVFQKLEYTRTLPEIDAAVYGQDPLAHQWVAGNPLLTKGHCRSLWNHIDDISDCRHLIVHETFPSDLLHEIALVTDNPVVRTVVVHHPNVWEETLVFASLNGWVMP